MLTSLSQSLTSHHASPTSTVGLLTPPEATQLITSLRPLDISELGNNSWIQQHNALEKLNMQAHWDAQVHSEEFVKEGLVLHQKLGILVHNLLVFELWHDNVLPYIENYLINHKDPTLVYMLLYHESTVANLLEIVLHHEDAAKELSEEEAIELCDWCSRRLSCAIDVSISSKKELSQEYTTQQLLNLSPKEEWTLRQSEIQLATASSALTMLRYLSDHTEHLSLGILTRMASTNDTIGLATRIIQNSPWERKLTTTNNATSKKSTLFQRFENGQWTTLSADGASVPSMEEFQAWLLLNNLLTDPLCMSRLDLTDSRREELVASRPRLGGAILERLPMLTVLLRYFEELSMGVVRPVDPTIKSASCIIVEHVSSLRANLIKGRDWKKLAEKQRQEQFSNVLDNKGDSIKKRAEDLLAALDFLPSLVSDTDDRIQSNPLKNMELNTVKVDVYSGRINDNGSSSLLAIASDNVPWTWHCTFTLNVCTDKEAEVVTLQDPTDTAPDEGVNIIKGERRRVVLSAAASDDGVKPMPTYGRLVVRYKSLTCHATYELPEADRRDASNLPGALWVTVGTLGEHGMALQLKVKKMAQKAEHRDPVSGGWLLYNIFSGALTVKKSL